MSTEPEMMSDKELDALLSMASKPTLPLGAKSRLLAKVSESESAKNSSVMNRSWVGWLAAAPLAASLALGVYLGRATDSGSFLPSSAYELLAGVNAEDPETGIEDAESLTEGDLS